MKKILAIDLGKFKSVACLYCVEAGTARFETIPTEPRVFHDVFALYKPDRVVIEIGSQAGWICDLAEALGIEIQVANPDYSPGNETQRRKGLARAVPATQVRS